MVVSRDRRQAGKSGPQDEAAGALADLLKFDRQSQGDGAAERFAVENERLRGPTERIDRELPDAAGVLGQPRFRGAARVLAIAAVVAEEDLRTTGGEHSQFREAKAAVSAPARKVHDRPEPSRAVRDPFRVRDPGWPDDPTGEGDTH